MIVTVAVEAMMSKKQRSDSFKIKAEQGRECLVASFSSLSSQSLRVDRQQAVVVWGVSSEKAVRWENTRYCVGYYYCVAGWLVAAFLTV